MTRGGKWFIIALLGTLVVMLLRMKLIAPASIISGIMVLAGLCERIMRVKIMHDMHRRQSDGATEKNTTPTMTTAQACAILGVKENAGAEAIKTAYLQQIKRNHPDAGGTEFIAAQINQAKEILLKNLGNKR